MRQSRALGPVVKQVTVVFSVMTGGRRQWARGLCNMPDTGGKGQKPCGSPCNRSTDGELDGNDFDSPGSYLLCLPLESIFSPLPRTSRLFTSSSKPLLTFWWTIAY